VLGIRTLTDRQQLAHMTFTLEIPDIETLSRILALDQNQMPNVSGVRRRGVGLKRVCTLLPNICEI
jgi:(p)ppGpp synthase/HD superfamily hydrolase